jgi:hypothetical protein
MIAESENKERQHAGDALPSEAQDAARGWGQLKPRQAPPIDEIGSGAGQDLRRTAAGCKEKGRTTSAAARPLVAIDSAALARDRFCSQYAPIRP